MATCILSEGHVIPVAHHVLSRSPASARKQKTRTGVSAGPDAMSVSLYTPPGRCWKRAMPGPGLVSMMVVASCRPPGPAREKTEPAPR
jgi:hypothetical protein